MSVVAGQGAWVQPGVVLRGAHIYVGGFGGTLELEARLGSYSGNSFVKLIVEALDSLFVQSQETYRLVDIRRYINHL